VSTLSPKLGFFIFAVSVGIVIFLVLDLVNLPLPYVARYAVALIAIALYVLVVGIKARAGGKPNHA
jgi:uncharacterized membrane protein YczE